MKVYEKPEICCLNIEAKEAYAAYPGRCLWDTYYGEDSTTTPICNASTDVDRRDGDCYYGPLT